MKYLVALLGLIIVILIGLLIFVSPAKSPTTNEIATTSMPAPSISSDGHLEVDLPYANDAIASPVAIEGKVTGGGWFFEATFPIKVINASGTVIGRGTAQALSGWMSTGTVPFSASIAFTAPHTATGTIVFSSDNPSGLPQNQKTLIVPVRF